MRGFVSVLLLAWSLSLLACSSRANSASNAAGRSGAAASGGEHSPPESGGQARATDGGAGATSHDGSAAQTGSSRAGTAATNGAGTGEAGNRDLPATCQASAEASMPLGKDTFAANSGKQEVAALTYTNVGASGLYAEVVSGWSKATGCVADADGTLCKTKYRQPKAVSGALAPFDEEMSFVFAGPIELYQVAVYQPGANAWQRIAYWDRCVTDGLAFAGNKSWYECNGFVESYVTADGTAKSETPLQFAGKLAAGTELHGMSNALCSGSGADSDCGWSSGLPLHGFKGDAAGSKLFAVKLRMPLGTKTPAYWILPSQVIRSSQYGCNCRGAGSDPIYKGGCGELDVAEILGGVTTSLEATSTLYSFQGITGGGSVAFNRPVNEAAVFLAIFDAPGRQIAIRRLAANAFDFSATLTQEVVTQLLADKGTLRALPSGT
jgi:hypothetical protein